MRIERVAGQKHGMKAHRSWRKLHVGVDADAGWILAAMLSTSDVNDAAQVGRLLNRVTNAITSATLGGS